MTTTNSKHLSPVYQGRNLSRETDARPATTTASTFQQPDEQKQQPSKKLTPYEPKWLWDYDYFMIAH
ncbi:hypothetical protein MR578_00425 [bacterium]|nr:hypothetical protein [bacterium]